MSPAVNSEKQKVFLALEEQKSLIYLKRYQTDVTGFYLKEMFFPRFFVYFYYYYYYYYYY